ncbi:hypothetical protein Csa_022914, partial [Cucumis sativus]
MISETLCTLTIKFATSDDPNLRNYVFKHLGIMTNLTTAPPRPSPARNQRERMRFRPVDCTIRLYQIRCLQRSRTNEIIEHTKLDRRRRCRWRSDRIRHIEDGDEDEDLIVCGTSKTKMEMEIRSTTAHRRLRWRSYRLWHLEDG